MWLSFLNRKPKPKRTGRLLEYPDEGYLYVSTDWHGDYEGFLRWISAVEQHIEQKKPKKAFGLVLGDVIDPKPDESTAERDDVELLKKIDEANKNGRFGVECLLGNHECKATGLYVTKEKYPELVSALYDPFIDVFSFAEHMTDAYHKRFYNLAYAAKTENGIVLTHGGLPKGLGSLDRLTDPLEEDISEILEGSDHDLSNEIVRKKLARIGCRYSISGHKSLHHFPDIREGIGYVGDSRLVFTSSEGFLAGRKTALCIDLARDYRDLLGEMKDAGDVMYLDGSDFLAPMSGAISVTSEESSNARKETKLDMLCIIEQATNRSLFKRQRTSVDIVCAGDSLTGWNNQGKVQDWPFPTYPQFLQELTNALDQPLRVANGGMAGEVSVNGMKWVREYLELFRNAKYFIIGYGTNDLAQEDGSESVSQKIIRNLDQISTLVSHSGKIPILFNVPYVNESLFSREIARETHAKRDYHNAQLKQYCDRNGITLVDICGKLGNEHFGDNLHPNEAGARIIAREIYSVLGCSRTAT